MFAGNSVPSTGLFSLTKGVLSEPYASLWMIHWRQVSRKGLRHLPASATLVSFMSYRHKRDPKVFSVELVCGGKIRYETIIQVVVYVYRGGVMNECLSSFQLWLLLDFSVSPPFFSFPENLIRGFSSRLPTSYTVRLSLTPKRLSVVIYRAPHAMVITCKWAASSLRASRFVTMRYLHYSTTPHFLMAIQVCSERQLQKTVFFPLYNWLDET